MNPFTATYEMRGRPVGLMLVFGSLVLFFAATCGVMSFYGQVPVWFGWLLGTLFGLGGLSLLYWAAFCTWRRVAWQFKADDASIVWFWTDRRGGENGRKEVAVRDLIEIRKSRGSGETAGGLYLKLRSGETVDIGGVLESERRFLEWASANYRNVNLKIE